jgi:hypothetical protein
LEEDDIEEVTFNLEDAPYFLRKRYGLQQITDHAALAASP